MKCAAALGLALTASLSASGAAAATTASTAQAASWLRAHAQPQQDELAELRAENPSAYAIVKALLTKRSLGLLDPRHPSPSFSAAAPAASEEVPGVEAFAKIAQESGEKPSAALAYPEAAAAPAHHDWLNWKPPSSAADDAAAVAGAAPAEDSPADAAPPAVQAPPPPAPAEKPSSGENSYLKGVDFFGDKQAAPRKPAHSLASQDSHDYLASFSWDDDKPAALAAPKKVSEDGTQGQQPAQAGGAPKNALLSWLGGGQSAKGSQSFLGLDAEGSV